MLAQNRCSAATRSAASSTCSSRSPPNPAMLLWLSGRRQRKGRAERELRARVDGAVHARRGQRLHRARRPRAGPRADRLDAARGSGGKGQTNFRFDAEAPRHGHEDDIRQEGDVRVARLGHALPPPPEAPAFFVTKLWSYFIPVPPDARTQARARALYTSGATRCGPVLDAILRHPALYTGPRMVKPPVVYIAGPPARPRRAAIDTSSWVWLSEGAGQRLFYPPNVAGWDDTPLARYERVPRPLVDRQRGAREVHARAEEGQEAAEGARTTPRRSSRARWPARQPDDPSGDPPRAACLRARLAAAARPDWKAEAYPPLVMNAVRQLLAVSPDLQTLRLMACCDEHSRAELLRRGIARPAAACPRSSPACRRPPGTGLDRRELPRPQPRARSRRLRRLCAAPAGVRRGYRGRRSGEPAANACSSPSSSTAVRMRSRCSHPAATRSTALCALASRSPAAPGRAFTEDPASLAPLPRPARRSFTARARST